MVKNLFRQVATAAPHPQPPPVDTLSRRKRPDRHRTNKVGHSARASLAGGIKRGKHTTGQPCLQTPRLHPCRDGRGGGQLDCLKCKLAWEISDRITSSINKALPSLTQKQRYFGASDSRGREVFDIKVFTKRQRKVKHKGAQIVPSPPRVLCCTLRSRVHLLTREYLQHCREKFCNKVVKTHVSLGRGVACEGWPRASNSS